MTSNNQKKHSSIHMVYPINLFQQQKNNNAEVSGDYQNQKETKEQQEVRLESGMVYRDAGPVQNDRRTTGTFNTMQQEQMIRNMVIQQQLNIKPLKIDQSISSNNTTPITTPLDTPDCQQKAEEYIIQSKVHSEISKSLTSESYQIKHDEYNILQRQVNLPVLTIKPITEEQFEQMRSGGKKKINNKRPQKQKYQEMVEDLSLIRYALYFADDVVQQGLRNKSELMHRKLTKTMDKEFERHLHEKEGIFFSLEIRPTSPRKTKHKDGVFRPFSEDPNKLKSDFSNSATSCNNQQNIQKQQTYKNYSDIQKLKHQGTFGNSSVEKQNFGEEQDILQLSPTFKQTMQYRDKEQQLKKNESKKSIQGRHSSPDMIQTGNDEKQPQTTNQLKHSNTKKLKSQNSFLESDIEEQDSIIDFDEIRKKTDEDNNQGSDGILRVKPTLLKDCEPDVSLKNDDSDNDKIIDSFEITVKKNNQDPRVKEVVAQKATTISKISNDFGVPEESAESSKYSNSENRIDDLNKISKMGSIININYDSPNIKEIRKQCSINEKEKLDQKQFQAALKLQKMFRQCNGSERSNTSDKIERGEMQVLNSQKTGEDGTENRVIFATQDASKDRSKDILANDQIDPISINEGKSYVYSSAAEDNQRDNATEFYGSKLDLNQLDMQISLRKKQLNENKQFAQSLETTPNTISGYPNNIPGNEGFTAFAHHFHSNSNTSQPNQHVKHPNTSNLDGPSEKQAMGSQNFFKDEIIHRQPPEPLSSLPNSKSRHNQERRMNRSGTVFLNKNVEAGERDRGGDGKMYGKITKNAHKKGNLKTLQFYGDNLSQNYSTNLQASSSPSSEESSQIDHRNILQINQFKSIISYKVSLADRKLARQAQLMNQDGQPNKKQDSIVDYQQINKDQQNEQGTVANRKLLMLNQKRQYSQNLGKFIQPSILSNKNISALQQQRKSFLNIKKNDTVEPLPFMNSLNIDSNGPSSNIIQESVSRSKKTGERSIQQQKSSYKDNLAQQKSNKSVKFSNVQIRRQRRKDMRQFKKFLEDYENQQFLTKEELEDKEIEKKQIRGLVRLKNICETLLGREITQNCFNGKLSQDDLSNIDQTTICAADNLNMQQLGGDTTHMSYMKSHGSKNQSVSDTGNCQLNNRNTSSAIKLDENFSSIQKDIIGEDLGPYLKNIEQSNHQFGRVGALTASKSEYQRIQDDFEAPKKQIVPVVENEAMKRLKTFHDESSSQKRGEVKNLLRSSQNNNDYDNPENTQEEIISTSQKRRNQFKQARLDTVSISGYNEDHKFCLNVRDVDFSHLSMQKSKSSNKSIDTESLQNSKQGKSSEHLQNLASMNQAGVDKQRSANTSRRVSFKFIESASSNIGEQNNNRPSMQDKSKSKEGISEQSDFFRKGIEANEKRLYDHRETFGPQVNKNSSEKQKSSKSKSQFQQDSHPSTSQEYFQKAESIKQAQPEKPKQFQLEPNLQQSTSTINPKSYPIESQNTSIVHKAAQGVLIPRREISQNSVAFHQHASQNNNIFNQFKQGGDEQTDMSLPVSPYLRSAADHISSSEQQSFSPPFIQRDNSLIFECQNYVQPQNALMSGQHQPSFQGTFNQQQLGRLQLVACQSSLNNNTNHIATQQSQDQNNQNLLEDNYVNRIGSHQSKMPFGLKIYELDMEVEQSRRANEDLAQSIRATEQIAGTTANLVHVDSDQIIEKNSQSPQFYTSNEQSSNFAGNSRHQSNKILHNQFQQMIPNTSPMFIGITSLESEERELVLQMEKQKPVIKKNAFSNKQSPNQKLNLNIGGIDDFVHGRHQGSGGSGPGINKHVNPLKYKRIQTSKNVLRVPKGGEPVGYKTNMDLLLSRNSKHELLSSNHMQGLSSVMSASESEFSFKKVPTNLGVKTQQHDQFEINMNRIENQQLKKQGTFAGSGQGGSLNPTTDILQSQQSISKVSKVSANIGSSSIGKELNGSSILNDSKSSNCSIEKKKINQTQSATKTGISLNLMKCLQDIEQNITTKCNQRQNDNNQFADNGIVASGMMSLPSDVNSRSNTSINKLIRQQRKSVKLNTSTLSDNLYPDHLRINKYYQQQQNQQFRDNSQERFNKQQQQSKVYNAVVQNGKKDFNQLSGKKPSDAITGVSKILHTSSSQNKKNFKTKYEQDYQMNLIGSANKNIKQDINIKNSQDKYQQNRKQAENSQQLICQNSRSQLSHFSELDVPLIHYNNQNSLLNNQPNYLQFTKQRSQSQQKECDKKTRNNGQIFNQVRQKQLHQISMTSNSNNEAMSTSQNREQQHNKQSFTSSSNADIHFQQPQNRSVANDQNIQAITPPENPPKLLKYGTHIKNSIQNRSPSILSTQQQNWEETSQKVAELQKIEVNVQQVDEFGDERIDQASNHQFNLLNYAQFNKKSSGQIPGILNYKGYTNQNNNGTELSLMSDHHSHRKSIISTNIHKQLSDAPPQMFRNQSEQCNQRIDNQQFKGSNNQQLQLQQLPKNIILPYQMQLGEPKQSFATTASQLAAQNQLTITQIKTVKSNSNSVQPSESQVSNSKMLINDDLNELQSILQRHHKKSVKKNRSKKSREMAGLGTAVDKKPGRTSVFNGDDSNSYYGMTSYSKYNKFRGEEFGDSPSKSSYYNIQNKALRTNNANFRVNNYFKLSRDCQDQQNQGRPISSQEDVFRNKTIEIVSNKNIKNNSKGDMSYQNQHSFYQNHQAIYKINDNVTDKQSIFNGSESHLDDDTITDNQQQHVLNHNSKYIKGTQHLNFKQRAQPDSKRLNLSPDLLSEPGPQCPDGTGITPPHLIQRSFSKPFGQDFVGEDQNGLIRNQERRDSQGDFMQMMQSQQVCKQQQSSKVQQPSAALKLHNQNSLYSSYSQQKRHGYTNYFQKKYVDEPRGHSNSRNSISKIHKLQIYHQNVPQNKFQLRPNIISQQTSDHKSGPQQARNNGGGMELLSQNFDTFSGNNFSNSPDGHQMTMMMKFGQGEFPQKLVLSMQPSAKGMGNQTQKGDWNQQVNISSPPGEENYQSFTRMTSIAELQRRNEIGASKQQEAKNITNFLQDYYHKQEDGLSIAVSPQTISLTKIDDAVQFNENAINSNTQKYQKQQRELLVRNTANTKSLDPKSNPNFEAVKSFYQQQNFFQTTSGNNYGQENSNMRNSLARSGKFGQSNSSKSKGQQYSVNAPSVNNNQNERMSLITRNQITHQDTIHQIQKTSQAHHAFEESRKSFDTRSQLKENILQQMKEPKMPVYYDEDQQDNTRFSLLSEMVQAQPYRPPGGTNKSLKKTYQESINEMSAGRSGGKPGYRLNQQYKGEADPDNPFSRSPSISDNQSVVLVVSQGPSQSFVGGQIPKDSDQCELREVDLMFSKNYLINKTLQIIQDGQYSSANQGIYSRNSQGGGSYNQYGSRIVAESNQYEEKEPEVGQPFQLHLQNHMDSEPTHLRYLQQKQQMMKKY